MELTSLEQRALENELVKLSAEEQKVLGIEYTGVSIIIDKDSGTIESPFGKFNFSNFNQAITAIDLLRFRRENGMVPRITDN